MYLGAFGKTLWFTQPTAHIDYLKQIFDPVDCASSIDPLNGRVGTLKYADYWHDRLWAPQEKKCSRHQSHRRMISLSKRHFWSRPAHTASSGAHIPIGGGGFGTGFWSLKVGVSSEYYLVPLVWVCEYKISQYSAECHQELLPLGIFFSETESCTAQWPPTLCRWRYSWTPNPAASTSFYRDSIGWKNFGLCCQAKNFSWGLEWWFSGWELLLSLHPDLLGFSMLHPHSVSELQLWCRLLPSVGTRHTRMHRCTLRQSI